MDYYRSKGMNVVRVPFMWERMQPVKGNLLSQDELNRLRTFVTQANSRGMTVILDPHSYGRHKGQLIGSATLTAAHFGDFWARLSNQFKNNPKVIFGLMNEPWGMPTEQWLRAANEGIRRIRGTGAGNLILVPGNAWSGAHSWNANWYGTPNGVVMKGLYDPSDNLAIEVHQYLDVDSSGTSPVCSSPDIGKRRLESFTAWLRENNRKAFLGEFAGANNEVCNQALRGMLDYMVANKDVWIGWTYWAGGPWWGDEMYTIEPYRGVERPQIELLKPYLSP